jgi:hypothetical protein
MSFAFTIVLLFYQVKSPARNTGNERPRRKQRGIEPAEIPNSFAFGINSTNASNGAQLVFSGCH